MYVVCIPFQLLQGWAVLAADIWADNTSVATATPWRHIWTDQTANMGRAGSTPLPIHTDKRTEMTKREDVSQLRWIP